jgi:uncharacterized protein with HEPN domain
MLDPVIAERIELIRESILLIESRTQGIQSSKDFVKNEESKMIMDAVAMRLQVIGENVKKISKLHPGFFEEKLNFDMDPIIRFRDFVAHHYEKTDYEIIFDICKHHIPRLKEAMAELNK